MFSVMKSSIHIVPVQGNSETHNERGRDYEHVRKDLSHQNESWTLQRVGQRLEQIKARYRKTTGQKMQKKATPIREGVALIRPDTSLKDLERTAKAIEERFRIRTFQIHIHKDEGHWKEGDWKPNLHAHMLFDWTDQATGKSIKMNRQDMAEMQTILAESLKMERGVSSSKKHLSPLQFKIEAREGQVQEMEAKLHEVKSELSHLKTVRDEIDIKADKIVAKNWTGFTDGLKTAENIKSLILENENLKKENVTLKNKLKNAEVAINKGIERLKGYISALTRVVFGRGTVTEEGMVQIMKTPEGTSEIKRMIAERIQQETDDRARAIQRLHPNDQRIFYGFTTGAKEDKQKGQVQQKFEKELDWVMNPTQSRGFKR